MCYPDFDFPVSGQTLDVPVPRRSLAIWAAFAIVMVAGAYFASLSLAVTCVYLPFLLMREWSVGIQTLALLGCGFLMALSIVWSLVPRRDNFSPPGILLEGSRQPHLLAEVENIARALSEPMPREIYLIPDV